MSMKKVLVLGGTGAMGSYTVPELAAMGYQVDVVSLDEMTSSNPAVTYTKANAMDDAWLEGQLKNGYDAIVDFMNYNAPAFAKRHKLLLDSTDHLIFLSSCRMYCGAPPTREDGARHLDTSTDKEFLALANNEYSLYKAMEEDMLTGSTYNNWTIVRPTIAYSRRRFQLVTLEAPVVMYRAQKKLPAVLPELALSTQATMTWSGDIGKMIARLVLKPAAKREAYTLATAEHHTWREIAEYYKELVGLEYLAVDIETYSGFYGVPAAKNYQLMHSRCCDKYYDNSKILAATGLKQSDLITLKDGLAREIAALPKDIEWPRSAINERMDAWLTTNKLI